MARGDRLFGLAFLLQRHAEVIVEIRVVRIDFQGLPVRGHGFVEAALGPPRDAKIVMSHRESRVELERCAKRGDGFIKMALSHESVAEIELVVRTRGIGRDCLANQIRCHVVAAGLIGNDAEQMQRVGMIWLRREDLPVESLGVRQAAGAVVLEREIEGLGNGHIADWSEGSDWSD